MPKVISTPPKLRPYNFHGMQLDVVGNSVQVNGDCPFCGKEGKFYLSTQTGLFNCKVCQAGSAKGGGNIYTFLRLLWEQGQGGGLEALRTGRKLLYEDTLKQWGVIKHPITHDIAIAGYGINGNICQLYRYLRDAKVGRHRLLPTPELPHGLYGLVDEKKEIVLVCEGPWDGMALWEVMKVSKQVGEGLALTASESSSLLSNSSVVAVPGAGVFRDEWLPYFSGKSVILLYDSDHPREVEGKRIEGAGFSAVKRVACRLAQHTEPPLEIKYLKWGEEGYSPLLPSGYDVRDWLTKENAPAGRVKLLKGLLDKIAPIPGEWLGGRVSVSRGSVGEVDCLPCKSWKELVSHCRKAMKWIEGLDSAFCAMLACITSTESVGDPLWLKVISPPSSGKSVLCEALSINRKYVYPKDSITGVFSGYQTDAEGSENLSLAERLKNKTLAIKDGDTLIQLPNLSQVLSQFRALYDRAIRTQFKNKMSTDWEGLNVTVILCGTQTLRVLDTSELGERFLDVVIVDQLDEELEDEIAMRVAYRAEREMSMRADGKLESREGPEMVKMKQLTGGYINYLRENAQQLIGGVLCDEDALRYCTRLGKFVAIMRARPSVKQAEKVERELSFRLVSQFVRLSKCLAVVLNKDEVDEEVLARTTKVAMDTARGRTLIIAQKLYEVGERGMPAAALGVLTHQSTESELKLLRFLRKIGAVEQQQTKTATSPKAYVWRLTERVDKLFGLVTGAERRKA